MRSARRSWRSSRDRLARHFVELQWDLGGLAYEMAIRDHFRLDVLVAQAADLQSVDAELSEAERLLKLDEAGAAGSCPRCEALYSRGAVFCWQCGTDLMERTSATEVTQDAQAAAGLPPSPTAPLPPAAPAVTAAPPGPPPPATPAPPGPAPAAAPPAAPVTPEPAPAAAPLAPPIQPPPAQPPVTQEILPQPPPVESQPPPAVESPPNPESQFASPRDAGLLPPRRGAEPPLAATPTNGDPPAQGVEHASGNGGALAAG